jgi:predicted secreted hydrolase
VSVPGKGLEAEVSALYPGAWMPMLFPYWEGPVRVTGSHPGRGYLEMTGYE